MSFLFLLAGDEGRRLSHWGRQISQSDRVFDTLGTRVSTETVRASARKIGLTATGLAVLVPIFVPTFSGTLFDGSGPGGDGDGDAVAIDNPMADLKRDLVRGRDVDVLDVYTVTGDRRTCGSRCSTRSTARPGSPRTARSPRSSAPRAGSPGRPA